MHGDVVIILDIAGSTGGGDEHHDEFLSKYHDKGTSPSYLAISFVFESGNAFEVMASYTDMIKSQRTTLRVCLRVEGRRRRRDMRLRYRCRDISM